MTESYLRELKDLTKDNPVLQDHFTQLEALLPKWQSLRSERIQSRGKHGAESDTDFIVSAREKDLFAQINVIVSNALKEENRLLAARLLKVRKLNHVTLGVSISTSLAMIALLLTGGLSLNREVVKTRSRTKELEIAVKELEAFTYSVAHDLRTPLRAVDGFSQILEEDYGDKLDAEGSKVIAVLRSESQRMGSLIDDLLTFSRIGRQESELQSIDMQALAQKVYEEIAAPAIGSGRMIHLDLHALPPAIGSLPMIRIIWVNLIDNAIKFTKGRNPAEIEINWKKGDAGETVYFIRDNGAGFDMRHVGKLFGVFQRLHSVEEFPGSGIGLSLVRRIVERHAGRVWAEGDVGKGASFYFTLRTEG